MQNNESKIPDWVEPNCRNCSHPLTGPYCSSCGQKGFKQRLSFNALVMSVPERIFNLERGLFFTFWQLCRYPGVTARDYVNGKRVDRVNPITYFVIAATAQLIALFLTRDNLKQTTIEQMNANPQLVEQMTERFGDNGVTVYADAYYNTVQQGYTYLALLFMVIPFSGLMWVFSKKQRTQYNFAELSVFSLYTVAHVILLTGILALVTVHISSTIHGIASMILYFVYAHFAVKAFFDKQHVSQVASFFALLFAVILFVLSIQFTLGVILAKQAL